MQRLTVVFNTNNDVIEVEHKAGPKIRYRVQNGALFVRIIDENDMLLWGKVYCRPISAEITQVPTDDPAVVAQLTEEVIQATSVKKADS